MDLLIVCLERSQLFGCVRLLLKCQKILQQSDIYKKFIMNGHFKELSQQLAIQIVAQQNDNNIKTATEIYQLLNQLYSKQQQSTDGELESKKSPVNFSNNSSKFVEIDWLSRQFQQQNMIST